jgi:hypothetical protein
MTVYQRMILMLFSVAAAEEVTEIRGRRVQGVGFGNIFGSGPINLRPTAAVPVKKEPSTPDGDIDKVTREAPRASVSCGTLRTVFNIFRHPFLVVDCYSLQKVFIVTSKIDCADCCMVSSFI